MSNPVRPGNGTQHDLRSGDQYDVAMHLTDELFEVLGTDKSELVDVLRDKVRPVIWHKNPPQDIAEAKHREAERNKVFKDVLQDLGGHPEKRVEFMDAYTRMGHLYELAGLVARDNNFQKLRESGQGIPGGITRFIEARKQKTPGQVTMQGLLDQLNKPVFEVVMTAHPTNVNSPEIINELRELGSTVDAVRLRKPEHPPVHKAMESFCRAPLIHQKITRDGATETRTDENLTVYDETKLMLSFMKNLYDDVPQILGKFTDSLDDHAKKTRQTYDPIDVKPQIRFAAWGSSGDKDGNYNVNADTTLLAMAQHKYDIINAYKDTLGEMSGIDNLPALDQWKNDLTEAQNKLQHSLSTLNKARVKREPLSEKQFSEISADVASVFGDLAGEKKRFEKDLVDAYKTTKTPEFRAKIGNEADADKLQQDVLNLTRRARIFGFGFGRIEYRETAEEYARVVGEIVPGYNEMDEAHRVKALTETLNTPGAAEKLLEAAMPRIQEGHGKPYPRKGDPNEKDALPIAYQTIKRMELARDHPGMVTDNVLAECEQTSNLLEAQFLQAAVGKNGKRPVLGIIPLFENPRSLSDADKTLAGAYANEAYQDHLRLVAQTKAKESDTTPEITQQVQIAHSDNTRRSGLPAARAFIDEAHDKIRAVNAKTMIPLHKGDADAKPVKTQFFEGGSASDALRGGVRAVTAACNQYGLNDFAKFTYQGGDLVNYFNYTPSVTRLFPRVIANMANNTANSNDKNAPHANRPKYYNVFSNEVAREALQATLTDYEQNVFKDDAIGVVLGQLGSGHEREGRAGAAGSRAQRGRSPTENASPELQRTAFAIVHSTSMGGVKKVNPNSIRTINFSEMLQHGGLVPTWIGSHGLEHNLLEAIAKKTGELSQSAGDLETHHEDSYKRQKRDFTTHCRDSSTDAPINPKHVKYLYDSSPVFKDVIDRMAFGVAMTDMDQVEKLHPELRNETIGNKKFLDRLEEEYKGAAKLCYAAFTGSSPVIAQDSPDSLNASLRFAITKQLPHIEALVNDKTAYRDLFLQAKAEWRREEQFDPHLDKLIHSGIDDVMHGRFPPADDIEYKALLQQTNPAKYGKPRESGNGVAKG